jgi:hypothetical protein
MKEKEAKDLIKELKKITKLGKYVDYDTYINKAKNTSKHFKHTKPTLEMFELSDTKVREVLKEYDNYRRTSDKFKKKLETFRILLVLIILWFVGYKFNDNNYSDMKLILQVIFSDLILGIVITFGWGWLIAYEVVKKIIKIKPSDFKYSKELFRYKLYQNSLEEYKWWQERKIKDTWLRMSGRKFEIEIEKLFKSIGYETTLCNRGGDGGIDIILNKDNDTIAVQCKAHKNKISPHVARDLYGTMIHNNIKKGMIVATNGFTKGTIDFSNDHNIDLMSLPQIMTLVNNK